MSVACVLRPRGRGQGNVRMRQMEQPSACARRPCPFGTPCDDAHVDRLLALAPVPAFVVCLVDGAVVWRNERAAGAGFRPQAEPEDCAEEGETPPVGEVVRRLRNAPSGEALPAAAVRRRAGGASTSRCT
ncbi:MAG: hypothetical protein KatS3mg010_0134 [Acidimicrobiia bacterium]|nr:MAG: hypothetical protein KatS3mg010_0134 [Acidimicrobiia bacterium]